MEQKTMKCIKCQKNVLVQNGVNTPNGFVCNDCMKKGKSKKAAIIAGSVLLLAIVGIVVYFVQSKKSGAVGFEGVANVQDSVNVSVQKPVKTFNLNEAVAQANPVAAGQTIDNIESFKRVFAENVQKAKELNNGSVVIPNISVLFDFNSSVISSTGDELLKEYANAYLQTNKEAVVLVEGFTCNIGGDDANNWMSEQRAKNVQQALIAAGIPESKLEVKWYGKSRFNEFDYSNKSEYRRVILSIK